MNNTVKVRFIKGTKTLDKDYTFHLPRGLRGHMAKKNYTGIVRDNKGKLVPVVITGLYRENIEDTGKKYQSIYALTGMKFRGTIKW